MIGLATPPALLALLAIPVLLALYWLRQRFEPRQVSSLFLWQGAERAHLGGRRIRRLETPPELLLEPLPSKGKTYAIWAMGSLLGVGGLSLLIYYLSQLFGG